MRNISRIALVVTNTLFYLGTCSIPILWQVDVSYLHSWQLWLIGISSLTVGLLQGMHQNLRGWWVFVPLFAGCNLIARFHHRPLPWRVEWAIAWLLISLLGYGLGRWIRDRQPVPSETDN